MSSFHCHSCGSVTDVSNMLQAFEQNPYCPACGLSASESDTKMQDELADMMSRNMHIGMQPPSHNISNPPTPQVIAQTAPVTYISQHYHHSAHVAPSAANEDLSTSSILRNAGVDASVLLPSQIQLFKNAQLDQQNRLVELWRIAPPTYGNQLVSQDMGNWPQTSMELEEEGARQRWQKQEQDRLKNLSILSPQAFAEPYMSQGYDQNMASGEPVREYRPATDPVHNREREWWHMDDGMPMEHQYGMLQQLQMLHGLSDIHNDKDQMMS